MALFQTTFFSQCLHRYVQANVVIPCDDFGTGCCGMDRREYKSLYLLHGYAGDRMEWLTDGGANGIALAYDIAIIMPSGDNSFYTDNPYYSHNYGEYISRELVEYTRQVFPLSQRAEDTFIAGMSMGGYGALYNTMRHPGVFGHVIALSSPTGEHYRLSADEPDFMGITRSFYDTVLGTNGDFESSDANLYHLARRVHEAGQDPADLYLACGWNDLLVHGNRAFHRFLTELGVPHVYEEGPGTHEWSFWQEYLRRGLSRHIEPRQFGGKNHPFWIERDEEGVM